MDAADLDRWHVTLVALQYDMDAADQGRWHVLYPKTEGLTVKPPKNTWRLSFRDARNNSIQYSIPVARFASHTYSTVLKYNKKRTETRSLADNSSRSGILFSAVTVNRM